MKGISVLAFVLALPIILGMLFQGCAFLVLTVV
jgi:hypothetical protein